MDATQFRQYVVRPTLKRLDLWSHVAEDLLIGTVAHESAMGKYLKQVRGPAMGVYQIEPATHRDIWQNFLKHRSGLFIKVTSLIAPVDKRYSPEVGHWASDQSLIWNMAYATAIARILYLRVPKALPPEDSGLEGLASYWKTYYNTKYGRGTEDQFIKHYRQYIA